MPQAAVALVGYEAGTALAGAIFGEAVLGAAITGTVFSAISTGFGIVGAMAFSSLAKKPSAPDYTSQMQGRTMMIRSSVANRTVIYGQVCVSGPLVYAQTTGPTNGYLHLVVVLAGHEIEEIGDIFFNDELVGTLDGSGNVTSGRFAGYARIKKHLGGAGQVADADLVSESGGIWTSNHVGNDTAYLYVRLLWNQDIWQSGVPNIKAIVKGRKVYDPRVSPQVRAYDSNWALCVNDYLTSDFGLGCSSVEVDQNALIAAANICDEQVAVDIVPTYQSRYEMHGSVDLGQRPVDTLKSMQTAGAGTFVFAEGVWRIFAGAYDTPVIEIDSTWLRDSVRMRPRPARNDLFNAVRGTYLDPVTWQPVDYPMVTNSTYEAEDNGEQIPLDLALPFTKEVRAAQRIAKIFLERARQSQQLTLPCNYKAFQVATWDNVMFTFPLLGLSSKVYRVVDWKWDPLAGVDLQLQEEASASYDWNYGEATLVDPAPDTSLANPWDIGAPSAPTVTESLYVTRDGRGVAAKATMTWSASSGPFLASYWPEYKKSSDSIWTKLSPTTELEANVLDVEPETYDFRVRASNAIGGFSSYGTTSGKEIFGLGAPPGTPTITGLQAAGGLAILTIQKTTELDVEHGGRVRVKHDSDTASPSWTTAFSIGDENGYPGDSTVLPLPLKPGVYFVKFEDSSGIQSTTEAYISTKQASVLAFTTLNTLQEDPTFPGTKTNLTVISSALELDASGGSVPATGQYDFSAGFDFGALTRVRVTGKLQGISFVQNDLIDSRAGNIDDWVDFDGSSSIGSTTDVWIEVRETDDDPTGSPVTWSDWKRLDAAEFECWGMEFRLQFRSYDTDFNVSVDTVRVVAESI